MVLVVCAVRDIKVDAFNRPFFMRHRQEALRSFSDEVNRSGSDNPLAAHPEDYELYELGHWEDSSAQFTLHERPVQIVAASSVVRVSNS